MSLTSNITFVLAVGSLLTLLVCVYLFAHGKKHQHQALWIAFIGATIATLGSLYYSEIAGFEPCRLCWYQRIFMYPLVLILGVSLWRKRDASDYLLALAIPGALIAAYHWGIQMMALATPGFSDSCSALGASCISAEFMTLGFISIPFLSLSMFLLLIVLAWTMKRK
jgi:disulfide bond formation protein DsbB